MLKILGKAASLNVRKVLWTCSELDIPFKRDDWGAGFQSPQQEAFLALNPNATVPVIVDGDFVLWESNAILRYLTSQAGRDDLLPTAARRRAVVDQWMDWASTELNTAWRYAFLALSRRDPRFANTTQIEHSVAEWNRHMQMLEVHLRNGPDHVAGDGFTLADIVLGLATNRWQSMPMLRPELPAVDAWMGRLANRAGYGAFCGNGVP